MADKNNSPECSFCGKSEKEVKRLIAGPGVFICDECVGLCDALLGHQLKARDDEPTTSQEIGVLSPHEIKQKLDELGHGFSSRSPRRRHGACSADMIIPKNRPEGKSDRSGSTTSD